MKHVRFLPIFAFVVAIIFATIGVTMNIVGADSETAGDWLFNAFMFVALGWYNILGYNEGKREN